MATTEEVWLSRDPDPMIEALLTGMIATVSVGIVQCHKWGQARLCSGPHALLHISMLDEAFLCMGVVST